jgi:hypothetical protein
MAFWYIRSHSMRRLIFIVGAEVYAVLLALLQLQAGVHTDEAKYLLNIPYPHPPLARWLFNLLEPWSGQELFWRILLATLLVQASLIVADLVKAHGRIVTVAAISLWVFSSSVVFQAGSIMMAPLTALQGLLFVWLFLRGRDNTAQAHVIGLLWLATLFTAYQGALYGPLVLGIVLRMRGMSLTQKITLVCLPVALLALYTLTNPLAAASIVSHGGVEAVQTPLQRIIEFMRIWALGGSIFLSIAGTIGLLLKPRWPLLFSFLLVCVYIALTRHDYYAVLLTPLFIAGIIGLMNSAYGRAWFLVTAMIVPAVTIGMYAVQGPLPQASPASQVMQIIHARAGTGEILINGSFGHDWQYASRFPVRRFQPQFLEGAQAAICLQPCADMEKQTGWGKADGLPIEVWIRK